MSIDMSQFYQVFFDETSEHLASMESLLLNLDVDSPSLEDLNAIFRAAHSIKGGSGTFGFTDMTSVTHVLETLLDRLRKEELGLRADMVDAFLAAGDVLRAQLEHHQGGPEADADEIEAVCARLNQLAIGEAAALPVESEAAAVPAVHRTRLECELPADVANDPRMLNNLLDGLAEIAALDIQQRPGADSRHLSLVLTTLKSDGELRELLAFYLSPDDITLSNPDTVEEAYGFFDTPDAPADESYGFFDDVPGLPEAVPVAEEAYGFFEDVPGLPVASGTEAYGFFDDAPGVPSAPSVAIQDEEETGVYGLFEDAAGKLENLPNRNILPGDSPAAIEGQGYGIYVDAPGGVGIFVDAPGGKHLTEVAAPPPMGHGHIRPGKTAKAAPAAPAAPAVVATVAPESNGTPAAETAKPNRRETDKATPAANSGDTSIRVSVEKVDSSSTWWANWSSPRPCWRKPPAIWTRCRRKNFWQASTCWPATPGTCRNR